MNEQILVNKRQLVKLFLFPDLLTLQLWKDKRDWEKNQAPTKGSISLQDYLGIWFKDFVKLFC